MSVISAYFAKVASDTLDEYRRQDDHQFILDIYNSFVPLPRGYKMKHSDPWCAAFVSYVAMVSDLTDIVPPECSCTAMIAKHKTLGQWSADKKMPAIGDIVFYSWKQNGQADHTGIVTEIVSAPYFKVIEGNKGDKVGIRNVDFRDPCILGYAKPNFSGRIETVPEWAKEAVQWAVTEGLTDGSNMGETPTLYRLLTILYRYERRKKDAQ